jgi:diguanylate cyclase (GGDEF)-like protein
MHGEIPDRIEKGNIFTNAIKDSAKPILIKDISDTGIDAQELPVMFQSMIAHPIYRDTKIIGCLELYRKDGPSFDVNDIILIKHLLLSSEKVIEQVISREADYDEALDIRTDIPQRHVILDILFQYEELSKRLSFPLSVAILEIEDRDKFGLYQHLPEGVRTLKTLAKRIQDGLRRYDKVIRYEELSFFVILPGCSSQDSITALHNATLSLGADLANNMTMGIATMPDEAQDAKGLINIAHQALSHAKKKGIHMARYSQTGALKQTNLSLCLLYTSPSPRDRTRSRMPSSA